MYVVDTDVLSSTNPGLGVSNAEVETWRRWVRENQHGLYISVVTVMEVRFGIEKCRAKGATAKADRLRKWLVSAETLLGGRIVPVSLEIAHKAGDLLCKAASAGTMPSAEDAIVAATAEVNGFTVLSRNVKHMKAMTDHLINPLAAVPPVARSPR